MPFYLIFDGLVVNGENVMHLNFRHRLSAAHNYVMSTYSVYRMIREETGAISEQSLANLMRYPYLTIFMKDVFEVWDTPNLLKLIESQRGVLMHENDGLIFTVDRCPYYPNIAPDIIKWKPPILNTIDFELMPIRELERHHVWGLFVIQNQ